ESHHVLGFSLLGALSLLASSGGWEGAFRWVQQKSGEGPRFIHCNGCSRGAGISDRFTATASGNTGTLTITNVQAEDEADYICVGWYGIGSSYQYTVAHSHGEVRPKPLLLSRVVH
uniref:Immunoglobulin V-set domain-containing protein n=1 Tax=Anolis carolinensis TaxID=28377 RepID=A0A803T1J3_ANOCA